MPAIARKKFSKNYARWSRQASRSSAAAPAPAFAKAEEAGGIDLIIIYNSGRYRMAGRGSAAGLLAYGNANEIVKDMAREVLPVVKNTPVLAGVNGTDPFVLMPQFLGELKAMGFSGVQNFPTIGLFDGNMRQSFEETGMGFGLEVDMIGAGARPRPPDNAVRLQPGRGARHDQGGADIVVAHMGVTTGGTIGATSAKSLDDCVREIDAISAAARSVRKDVIAALPWRPDLDAGRCPLFSSGRTGCTAFTARRAWSGCRRKPRSPPDQEFQGNRVEEDKATQEELAPFRHRIAVRGPKSHDLTAPMPCRHLVVRSN